MTIEQLNELPDERLRVMCAELCGYKLYEWGITYPDGKESGRGYVSATDLLPNYPADLNAMHEAEKTLKGWGVPLEDEAKRYFDTLIDVCNMERPFRFVASATTKQRAVAFIAVKQTGEVAL